LQVVAAGPFCCPEDVAYEPLKDLLAYVVAEQVSPAEEKAWRED
jgi:hypothetical protein